jgi:hypothetical protein
VKDIDHLPPFTWLITEVDGTFGVKAKVNFGFDFSWLRETAGGGLSGDIGLKLQTGLSASLGFTTSGKYAIALSRESEDKKIRLRLFKLRVNGWDFGFSGKLTATQVVPLPDRFDDLLSAVVGTHHQQIVKLLGQVEDWTDPRKPLFGPLVNLADGEARQLIETISGVADLNAAFEEVKGRIQKVFKVWNGLPQETTNLIWSKLQIPAEVIEIAKIAKHVAASDSASTLALIRKALPDVEFLNSTVGKALSSFALKGLFAALHSSEAVREIQQTAKQVADLLDGSTVQGLLTKLQNEINTRLDITQIERVVDHASLDRLDSWLKARLESFLEQKIAGPAGVAAVQKLRAGLAAIIANRDELYAKALQALQRTYHFKFNAMYQSTTSSSALLDAIFDFGAAGTQAAGGLALALEGKFDELLADPISGVEIQEGVLAFGIHKESHVSLALPYFSTSSAHVNDTLAKLSHVHEDGGGLIYSLEASDIVTAKNDFSSALAVSLSVPGGLPNVLVHSTDSATYRYDFKVAVPHLTATHLESGYAPYVHAYLSEEFKPTSPGTFEDWVEGISGGTGRFGHSVVSLSVSLPPKSLLIWLTAPESDADPKYKLMSIRLQKSFKRLLHDTLFADIRNYREVSGDTAARAVLAFCSVPPCSNAVLVNSGEKIKFLDETAKGNHLYWDYRDRGENLFNVDLRAKVLSDPATITNLRALLQAARMRISAAGDPDHVLRFYEDARAGDILGDAIQGHLIDSLFPVEGNMVGQARQAGLKMAEFRKHKFANPVRARKDLAQFGQKLTEDFNHNMKNFAVGDALLPLGTLAYIEAVSALDPQAAAPSAAMFSLEILKPGAVLKGMQPDPGDVLRSERVVHAG